jgi:hypothetical protein
LFVWYPLPIFFSGPRDEAWWPSMYFTFYVDINIYKRDALQMIDRSIESLLGGVEEVQAGNHGIEFRGVG